MAYIGNNKIIMRVIKQLGDAETYNEAYNETWELALKILGLDDGSVVVIPAGTIACDKYCRHNTTVKIAVIPHTCQNTGNNGFNSCTRLEYIYIPEGVNRIDAYCFHKCSSLEDIKIPSTVITIYEGAFWGCVKLKTFDLTAYKSAETLPKLRSSAINNDYVSEILVSSEEIKSALLDMTNWCNIDASKFIVVGA